MEPQSARLNLSVLVENAQRREERGRCRPHGYKHKRCSSQQWPLVSAPCDTLASNPKFTFFSLSLNVNCDKGIPTMSASLCLILCLFRSSSPLSSLRPLFYLRWIVIMWSKWAPPSLLNEKKWGTKSSSVQMKKEKKEKACVFSCIATLCLRLTKFWHIEKNAPGARRLSPGSCGGTARLLELWTELLQRATLGICLPLCSWGFAARPRFDVSVCFGVCECVYMCTNYKSREKWREINEPNKFKMRIIMQKMFEKK